MKPFKHKVTFKIIIGYLILGITATLFAFLVLSEIKTFTQIQGKDASDKNKILKIGNIIADIYENDNLGRAAIQLNSSKKFNEYLNENDQLLLKIDSLNFIINNKSQEFIVDSIKVVINKKLQNVKDLKKVKSSFNSDESINNVINKLNYVDSLLNKAYIDNILKNIDLLSSQKRINLKDFSGAPKKQNIDTLNLDQIKVDSLIAVSRHLLKETQKETQSQRISLYRKERELIASDLIISRKLRELLNNLKTGILKQTNDINKQKEKSFNRSKNIILFATIISLLIIIIFSANFLNDFWKNKRYRDQLEEANKTASSLLKSREQLISMVSHDLRTPLSTIIGYNELLQKASYNVKEKNYLEHIGNASTYMKQLVDDLMEFSKIDSGSISLNSIPFDLEKTINETTYSVENLILNKPVKFILKHDPAIKKYINSDPFRLKQVLNNLITNAGKFTDEGTITIESNLKLIDQNNILEISITDTGIGIPADEQETIFKAFTQVDTNYAKKGFGLGLTISKKLIELLNGTLSLQSVAGEGSTFTLSIPVQLSNSPITTVKPKEKTATFNLTVIIVEDDASIRQLLKDIFSQYKIKPHLFNNAQEALETIDTIAYDIVFTDIQLPKMNGIHFMEILKNHKGYKDQPIIAMTGRLNLSREDYLKSGFSEILSKPFKTQEIQDVLSNFSGCKKTEKESKRKQNKNNGFDTTSLETFFNDDYEKINNTLSIFLEDTKTNYSLLKEAKEKNDVNTFNSIGHKMVSMFKQLKATKMIPFLETFEVTHSIDHDLFTAFESELENFIHSLEKYLKN